MKAVKAPAWFRALNHESETSSVEAFAGGFAWGQEFRRVLGKTVDEYVAPMAELARVAGADPRSVAREAAVVLRQFADELEALGRPPLES